MKDKTTPLKPELEKILHEAGSQSKVNPNLHKTAIEDPHYTEDAGQDRLHLLKKLETLQAGCEQMARNLDEWHQILDAIEDPIFVHDREFRILHANQAFARKAGMPVEKLFGRLYWEVLKIREEPFKSCLKALDTHQEEHEEIQLADDRFYNSRSFVITDTAGHYMSSVHILEDITELKLYERSLERINRALTTLSQCDSILIHASDESALVNDICRLIVEGGGYPMSWMGYVLHDDITQLRRVAQCRSEDQPEKRKSMKDECDDLALYSARRALASNRPYIIQNIPKACNGNPRCEKVVTHGYNALISLPIAIREHVIGALTIFASREGMFDKAEFDLLAEMVDDLAFGIVNLRARKERARLEQAAHAGAQRLQHTLVGTIEAIATALEKRDPCTAGHQQKVARLAHAIAEELGLSNERCEGIRLGALIHDIGKIYVPAEILNRSGKLTEAEYRIIRSHPQVGFEIINGVDFPWPVAQMVFQHHERLDGSGYPEQLKGDAITLEARILAVADVVEAISSHRPYRPALGIDFALEEIQKHQGILYDTAVVNACIHLFRHKGFTFDLINVA